jgi:crotonobetainyl-CoA:carnitine CoA-transferase CaiB-like acyl-CoA transferase
VRSPYRFDHLAAAVRGPPPGQGKHNTEVLRDLLGMSADEIAALEAEGVLQRTSGPD